MEGVAQGNLCSRSMKGDRVFLDVFLKGLKYCIILGITVCHEVPDIFRKLHMDNALAPSLGRVVQVRRESRYPALNISKYMGVELSMQ